MVPELPRRELTPEVTRRVIYRGASVPPPASYTVREMVTPQVAPRITVITSRDRSVT